MQNKILTLLLVAVAAIGIAACGGSDSTSSTSADTGANTAPAGGGGGDTGGGGGATAALKVTADPSGSLAWSPTNLDAEAGQVTLELENASPIPHNIQIEGEGDVSDTISNGDTATVTEDLKPGTYTYFCDIPQHRESGMEGTLTVK